MGKFEVMKAADEEIRLMASSAGQVLIATLINR